MYLHVGNNRNIRIRSIVGIFDMDNSTVSMITRKFLGEKQKSLQVEAVSGEIPKSFILYLSENEYKICFSPLSVAALYGRAEDNSI